MNNSVSIIIPSFNRPDTLRAVIDSYINQNYVKELIIIDDASTKSYDNIKDYIYNQCIARGIKFIYHRNNKNMGAAYCRNKGIGLCSSYYILWGEDDLFLRNDYIKVLVEKNDGNTINFGKIYYGILPTMSFEEINNIKLYESKQNNSIFNYALLECYFRLDINQDIEVPFGHAIILVPKKSYTNVHYFENYSENGYREETDAQVQMLKEGYKIIFTGDTECYHLPHKKVEKGGQHKHNQLIWEIYTILNNNKFLDRHYQFLREKYKIPYSKMRMKAYFVYNRIYLNYRSLMKKLRRCLRCEN